MKITKDNHNKKFIKFLEKFNKLDKGGLIIIGKRGIGKTFLTKNIIDYTYFISESEFIQKQKVGMLKISNQYDGIGVKDLPLEMLSNAKTIIYDDYGSGTITEAYITNMMYWIDKRISKGLKTIITSNLSTKEIMERDSRIGSRILELCDSLKVKGIDRRLKNHINIKL